MAKSEFKFISEMWVYPGESANWHFVSVPRDVAREIKAKYGKSARGWGSLQVEVTMGKSRWKSSIFPDKKSGTYLLPVKAAIRTAEGIREGDKISVLIKLRSARVS